MRYIRWCYLSADDRRRFPHQLRDGDAALELFETLNRLKFNYGGVFINWPFPKGVLDTSMADLESLGMNESDILLLTTRPPINDDGKKTLRGSSTGLERKIFGVLVEKCFKECSRTTIAVHPHIGNCFLEGYENRSDVEYFAIRLKDPEHGQSKVEGKKLEQLIGDASYKELGGLGGQLLSKKEMMRKSAGYIVHLPLGPDMPRLLAVFGLSGTMTLLFAYCLGSDEYHSLFEKILKDPGRGFFVMFEISTKASIPERPATFDSCLKEMGWDMKIIAEVAESPVKTQTGKEAKEWINALLQKGSI